ncbi:phage minor tail protein L [Dickeya solani]|uniref:Phage minor tail protein L n=1 Tax=Dickeya solani TaxID=1089444 RepID=A0ABU4EMY2_9GAMM|nr:phage minor tail protein L [Dickeya solani]MCA6998226.1 phage minor tail protein L [Dickeya solani]MDV6997143.1 phage minor tail protein L [Dickeya solani]MDV7004454.1 phage minor tail protein L [Dickeya solani]MDV7040384.1 phage minor tail protein L [Dickeya solani]MDV7044835.1 phage minor tail protein L [Dickeya solani]
MRDIPSELIIQSVDAGVGAFIDLFDVNLQPLGGDIIRFHAGTNGYYGDVIWKGLAYSAYPIAVEGLETKNEGAYARPTMKVANITGLITGINADFDDALGAVVTRRQVPVSALDAVNFPSGNPDADPTQEAVSRYVIEEMAEETFETVTYNLATPIDCDNAIIPARTILADVCQWLYRGDGCGYTGGPVADERDNPTGDASKDRCSHRKSGCRLRFPKPAVLPIGTFPGSSKVS